MMLRAGLGIGALGALVVGGVTAGVSIGGFGWLIGQMSERVVMGSPDQVIARIPARDHGDLVVKRKQLSKLQLLAAGDRGSWQLGVPFGKQVITLEGDTAVQALGKLLPQVNRFGGSQERIDDAVALLERETDPARFFDVAASHATTDTKARLSALPKPIRLALEMAAHEDTERRALEGELAMLEQAWKQAEEIAAIADNMFVPAFVDDWMRKHRKG